MMEEENGNFMYFGTVKNLPNAFSTSKNALLYIFLINHNVDFYGHHYLYTFFEPGYFDSMSF